MQTMRKKKASRVSAVVLALMMAVTFIPTFAFAADGSSDGITVYMTVSDEGVIAQANDGSPMAWKEVQVSDTNEDGTYTFDEALVAAHKAYNSEDGLDIGTSGWVNKLWGKTSAAGSSFMTNNIAERNVVTMSEIKDGDHLVASLNQDVTLYADWTSNFDCYEKTVYAGDSFKLNLQGYQAMTTNDFKPAAGVNVGIWDNGEFKAIEGAVTDTKGNATLSFTDPGTYYVTAQGAAADEVDAVALWVLVEADHDKDGKTIYGKLDWSTYESFIGYTEKDYGKGPYPWEEIQWIDLEEFDADEFDAGYLLYSGNVISNCPLIAPACIVTVKEKTDLSKMAAKLSKTSAVYTGKAIKPAATVSGLKAGTDFTTTYKNNTAIGKATVTITGKNAYSGTITKTFKIVPAKAAISKAKKGKKKITVTAKAQKGGVKYQVAYKLKNAKTWKYKKSSSKKIVLKGLKAKKKYTVKVRAYKGSYYGAWSKAKTVKTK